MPKVSFERDFTFAGTTEPVALRRGEKRKVVGNDFLYKVDV